MRSFCALAAPVWAADEHAKVLIDATSNLATANWKVSSAEWGSKDSQAWNVQLRTLHGGRQEGVQVIDVDNGAMTFTIVPTRGFEVWKAQAGRLRLGWDSPVGEIIHPSYIRLTDNGGQYRVSDVTIGGMSMKVALRDQFASWIETNGGRVNALLAVMRQQIARQW